MMNRLRAVLRRFDSFQQRHPWAGFPVAVGRKFNDDRAGSLGAVIAYYAFLAVFPLLLVLVVVLSVVLHGHPALQQRALGSALADFPVIGGALRTNVSGLHRSGLSLVLGLLGTLIGARGVANAAQHAFNTVWAVPYKRRPGFPWSQVRSFAAIGVIGLGVLTTTALSGIGEGFSHLSVWVQLGVRLTAFATSLVLNVALFWLGFRITTAAEVPTRALRTGAVLAAVAWQLLQAVGGYLIGHELRHASTLYGVFGLVLGLLFWLHIQAQLTLFVVEADVVRARGLWPRSLLAPPYTEADRVSFTAYAKVEERHDGVTVDVTIEGSTDGR
ncbi:YihY/virulence factor BrkB family protein [Catenulispora sp. NF23]|uniref:YihY/virulence factor BrkB family protein n=1 Tax=Catenulispora pinistramenti TaxID=2705254 RepID=A0ABS5L193_9ACTN|nr:YihY/virulence factor BrkB family protein [Catenulispora pinistramenti]MBS2536173.1 YihY/virulence factor BrkB family protein [Catenulispora pinistramenti]MBS2552083.1 YihY/virulence factor BrkB family protein [Catenulispora pinistramenti]